MFSKSKIIFLLMVSCCVKSFAQHAEPIKDNSFLIEEAYNQEKGVVQHINMFNFNSDFSEFEYSFTQEWPLGGIKNQFSYSLPFEYLQNEFTLQNIILNYRYQLLYLKKIFFAPEISLIFSVPEKDKNLFTGVGFNLPLSYEVSPLFSFHLNEGGNFTSDEFPASAQGSQWSYFSAGSIVYSPAPKVNFLCEAVYNITTTRFNENFSERKNSFILNPGLRGGFDFKSGLQIVPGISLPVEFAEGETETSLLFYLSFEHPFKKSHEHTD